MLAIKRKIDYNYYRQHSVLIKTATIYNYNFQNYKYKISFFNKNFFVPELQRGTFKVTAQDKTKAKKKPEEGNGAQPHP